MTDLPYPEPADSEVPATAGHSGSDTSRDRAVRQARTGQITRMQRKVLSVLAARADRGLTVAELRALSEWHHGSASSVLSTLHQRGRIARLTVKRGKCLVYVLPEHVNDRPTSAYTPNKRNRKPEPDRCPYPATVCEATEAMLSNDLAEARARLHDIHVALGSHRYDGQPTARLNAIRDIIDHRR